jgi:hypothetical protein
MSTVVLVASIVVGCDNKKVNECNAILTVTNANAAASNANPKNQTTDPAAWTAAFNKESEIDSTAGAGLAKLQLTVPELKTFNDGLIAALKTSAVADKGVANQTPATAEANAAAFKAAEQSYATQIAALMKFCDVQPLD